MEKYKRAEFSSERNRLESVLKFYVLSGDIPERQAETLKRNLDYGSYRLVSTTIDDILDGR